MKNPLQVLCRTNTAELSHLRDIVLGKLDNAALFKSRRSVVIIVNADNERDRLIRLSEEGIEILDVYVVASEDIEHAAELSRSVGDRDSDYLCISDNIGSLPENLDSLVGIVCDHSEDAEILCIGNAEGSEVYTVLLEQLHYAGKLIWFIV